MLLPSRFPEDRPTPTKGVVTRSGVTGRRSIAAWSGRASATALAIAAGMAIIPDSPMPLIPPTVFGGRRLEVADADPGRVEGGRE